MPIGEELPRADYLLLRKREGAAADDSAQTLLGLWPRLPSETVAELKSTGRPYRKRDLFKLLAYAYRYFATSQTLGELSELACVLLVPAHNRPLHHDLAELGLVLNEVNNGYIKILVGRLVLLLVEINRVTETEDDDVLRLFSHHQERTMESRRWWARWVGADDMKAQELEGHDEVIAKFLDRLTPEQRLAGLDLKHHLASLASLAPEQYLLGLPLDALRALSRDRDYLATLPAELREAILMRVGSSS